MYTIIVYGIKGVKGIHNTLGERVGQHISRASLIALTITSTAMDTKTVINVAYEAVTAMNLSFSSYMVSPMIFL